jgi:hypothetical protein
VHTASGEAALHEAMTGSVPGVFAAPTFQPLPGWFAATGDVSIGSQEVPRSWASNAPFAEEPDLTGTPPVQLIPARSPTDPTETLHRMGSEQIVLVARFELPEMEPAPAGNPNFHDAVLPLALSSFERQDLWQAQPSGTPVRYRGLFRVNRRYLTVDVYFGRRPDWELLARAQLQLGRLIVPHRP